MWEYKISINLDACKKVFELLYVSFLILFLLVSILAVLVGCSGGGSGSGATGSSLPQTQTYQLIAESLYGGTRLNTAAIYANDTLVVTNGYYTSQLTINSQVCIRPQDQVNYQNNNYQVDLYSLDGGSDLPMTGPEVTIIMSGNRRIDFRYSHIPTPP